MLLLAWRFKVLNRRRQAAASGDLSVPLAAEQPIPNEAALSLPFTVALVANRRGAFAAGSVLGFLFLLGTCWIPFTTHFSDSDANTGFTVIFAVAILGIAIGLAILMAGALARIGRHEITATEAGLTVRQGNLTFYTPWHEARLFAATVGIKRTGPPTSYELSSAAAFTPFTWLHRRTLFLPHLKPALPFDDYDRQMDALLSLIAAKTGLPLYDLRR